jgi:hypothetical protein
VIDATRLTLSVSGKMPPFSRLGILIVGDSSLRINFTFEPTIQFILLHDGSFPHLFFDILKLFIQFHCSSLQLTTSKKNDF